MKALICACCGSRAIGKQWWNRDTGFGLCAKCVQFVLDHGNEEELTRGYGGRGIHFATPLTRACVPGLLVSWKTYDGEYHVGVLNGFKDDVALIRGVCDDKESHRVSCPDPEGNYFENGYVNAS